MAKIKVLFVCLGNICRSPMAEGLFIHKVNERGLQDRFEIDSAGTSGWHQGEPADSRMRGVARGHGVNLPSSSRKLLAEDFREFDYILGMDASNMRDIEDLAREGRSSENKAELIKMRDFDEHAKGADVPDPYYGGQKGFEDVYEMLDRSTEALLDYILEAKAKLI
ncbi:MAG: low molecular weight phosphotyrosine protein phosphatase [Bacteroidia bacterium]|nr:low molecular weight phosphotyrosine protein phosphatase [Bacteroidia bacterium]